MRLMLALALTMTAASGSALAALPIAEAPPGVSVGASALGRVYVGKDRRTLYGLSLRSARARTSLTLTYCTGPCAEVWTPLKPAAAAKPIGKWTIVEGAQGPQWAFEGSPVFSFNADHKPGDVGGDRWSDLFLGLAYVPPKPALAAPPSVDARLFDEDYVLTDTSGHALFTSRCTSDCGARIPFAAGAASLPVGDWTMRRDGDRAQWAWRGAPVFVAASVASAAVAAGDALLKP